MTDTAVRAIPAIAAGGIAHNGYFIRGGLPTGRNIVLTTAT